MIAYAIGLTWKTRAGAREPVQSSQKPGFREVVWVWAGLAAVAAATLVTYTRIPPEELYHVSEPGLAGGLGRTLVLLNFPTALIAVAVLLYCAERLGPLALLPVPLCAVVALPGVVDQDDLDAKLVNLVPAAGVVAALVLTAVALRDGLGERGPARGDGLRVWLAALLLLASIPYVFAELGFYAPWPFLADEVVGGTPAVHLGRHHGTDGILLVLAALALSRQLPRFRRPWPPAVYLALMLSYGVANAAEDFWLEQVVKRGWTDAALPNVLHPALTVAWAAIVAGAAAIVALWFRPGYSLSRSQSPQSDIGT
jgi:hypothetical protein